MVRDGSALDHPTEYLLECHHPFHNHSKIITAPLSSPLAKYAISNASPRRRRGVCNDPRLVWYIRLPSTIATLECTILMILVAHAASISSEFSIPSVARTDSKPSKTSIASSESGFNGIPSQLHRFLSPASLFEIETRKAKFRDVA